MTRENLEPNQKCDAVQRGISDLSVGSQLSRNYTFYIGLFFIVCVRSAKAEEVVMDLGPTDVSGMFDR